MKFEHVKDLKRQPVKQSGFPIPMNAQMQQPRRPRIKFPSPKKVNRAK